jgi:acetyl-CoA carboxylase carboxyl transferase subunit alpha
MQFLEFEKPIMELFQKIEELKHTPVKNIQGDLVRLQEKLDKIVRDIYKSLTPWQKVQVARHQQRPKFQHYLSQLFTNISLLSGDRAFGDDHAIIGGLALFKNIPVMVIGQEKGTDVNERIKCQFGMPKPEGYRKATRLFNMAHRFRLPVITFIDTPGAYPGIDAEERGQAQAIAASIEACLNTESPIISVIIGEGGSGGAIAMAASDYVMMLEHSIYSVISPEGCASILFKSAARAQDAAAAQKLTSQELLSFKLIDHIIEEPLGGAHRHPNLAIESTGQAIQKALEIIKKDPNFFDKRVEKYLKIGEV